MKGAEWRQRLVTAHEAVEAIKSGNRVWIHPGTATPNELVQAMVDKGKQWTDVEIVHLLHFGKADYTKPEFEGHFRCNNMFLGANVREAVNEGRSDFIPLFLSEAPGLMLSGEMPVDVALLNVTPPDEYGYCSYGCGVDCTKAASQAAKIRIAQINPSMPRTMGDSFIHISKLHHIVEVDETPIELKGHELTDLHHNIAKHIEPLIDDGSTLQLGIGGVPDAVLELMGSKKDLGVHTEMFSDGIIPMIESGVINGEKKTFHPGKVIAGFFFGTKKIYEFAHNNPVFEFHPSDYTNDILNVSRNDNMVAINSALQVDLTGQVCADSIGYSFYSGIGGQVDFIRGAARAKGGKPIIALPSTAKGGTISRIVPYLDQGAGVVTSRGDVHYVVTEFGVAYMHGKNIRQRAKALIDIAHPDFQEDLTEFCYKQKIFR
jgi:4-hydroxybutyrate CoA-transferase